MSTRSVSRRELLIGAPVAGAALLLRSARSDIPAVEAANLVTVTGVSGLVSSTTGLNIRSGPGAGYSVVKWLTNGAALSITGTSGDWFKVRASGYSGWVNSWYVLLTGSRSVAITRGNTSIKRVALTFDCGSDYGYTTQILDTLATHGVTASFGLCGDWITSFPDGARAITDGGYQLLNHTLNHRSFTGLSTPGTGSRSPAKRLSQIQANESLIQRVTGKAAKPYWRPPYGDYDAGVLRDAGALGYTRTALWTIDSLGWNGLSADDIYWRVMNRMGWGAIVLMHVGAASKDANALDRLIRRLKVLGYQFATVDQVID